MSESHEATATDAPTPPERAEPIAVGVDGGGSKTRAVVVAHDGAVLGSAEGPASAVRGGSVPHSVDVIAACVCDALRDAGRERTRPAALVAGVAGVGREPERAALADALTARGLGRVVDVTTDAAIALNDAFGDGPGILLIAGTGSIAYGRAPDGRFERCGGWGPILGDEGGGAWIGRRALNVAAASADGREPETALLPALLTAIDGEQPSTLIDWAARATPADFATLAPVVLRTAADGDLRANSLLALGVEELVLHVRTLARALFVDERAAVPVAFAGGLLVRNTPLRRRLEHRLKTAVPGAQVRQADVEPVRGAVRGALRLLGIEMAPT
ncbi:N-acetylglucosamine kinase [Gemmatimonadetes bacterium T265]|nr:N-acetylglucosamine kinase [Gemmatimonadetes bacterium T265]